MKKFLLTITALIGTIGISIAAADTYSDTYIKNFDSCTPYSENYETEIPTQDQNTPVIHINSKEEIVGLKNGKCQTKSTAHCKEMNQDIVIVNCSFTKEQQNTLLPQMKAAKTSPQAKQQLQNTIANFVKNNPDTCQVKNLLQND